MLNRILSLLELVPGWVTSLFWSWFDMVRSIDPDSAVACFVISSIGFAIGHAIIWPLLWKKDFPLVDFIEAHNFSAPLMGGDVRRPEHKSDYESTESTPKTVFESFVLTEANALYREYWKRVRINQGASRFNMVIPEPTFMPWNSMTDAKDKNPHRTAFTAWTGMVFNPSDEYNKFIDYMLLRIRDRYEAECKRLNIDPYPHERK